VGADVSWTWTRATVAVLCVNWRSQLPTVRAVGIRANPQKRAMRGSLPRYRRCSSRRAPDVEQRQDEQGEAAPAIVSTCGRARGTQSTRQLTLPQVAPEQLGRW
jgi:hypothetical protein